MMRLLHEPETEDPILSVVNLIDVFLVIIAALLIVVAKNPMLNAFSRQDVTGITDAGKPSMEVVVKKGRKIEHYKSTGNIGQGEGCESRHRLPDERRLHRLRPRNREHPLMHVAHWHA